MKAIVYPLDRPEADVFENPKVESLQRTRFSVMSKSSY